MTPHPCRYLAGRLHHDGPCGCFHGGKAGEWPEEPQGATETGRSEAGDPRTATSTPSRALGGTDPTTEAEADEWQASLDDRDAMREHYGREEWAG